MHYPISELSGQQLYPLLVGAIIPRPIAWVSTQNEQGVNNLAPYSFFSVASVNPPVLTITQVNPQTQIDKDTLRNLKATHDCVVNIVSADMAEKMNQTCAQLPNNISEFEATGITTSDSQMVKAKGVENANVRYECRLREILTLSEDPMGGKLILLDVVNIYVHENVISDGKIQTDKLNTIGKLGGNEYTHATNDFIMERP